jgi:hypothetical protein
LQFKPNPKAIMDKELNDAIMALPQMKERIKRLHAYCGEKYGIVGESLSINLRLSSKTVANNKEDATSMDINNKLRELIDSPLK